MAMSLDEKQPIVPGAQKRMKVSDNHFNWGFGRTVYDEMIAEVSKSLILE